MPRDDLQAAVAKLDPGSQHVLQICALASAGLKWKAVASLSNRSGWKDSKGTPLTQAAVRTIVEQLTKQKLLLRGSYGSAHISPAIVDLVVQGAIRGDQFEPLCDAVQQPTRDYYPYYSNNHNERDLRIAFYRGQVSKFQSLAKSALRDSQVRLLDPFSQDIFERLDPILQEMYLLHVISRLIVDPAGDDAVLAAFDKLAGQQTSPSNDLVGCWLDLAVARGDLEALRRLDELVHKKLPEVAGCEALFRGDFVQAEQRFSQAIPAAGQNRRKSAIAATHLPALLCSLLLFKQGTAESLTRARSLVSAATKGKSRYAAAFEVVNAAVAFRQSPSSPVLFAHQLNTLCKSPLATLVAGYFGHWLLTDDDAKLKVPNLVSVANAYRRVGFTWLAAEASGLASTSSLNSTKAQAKKHCGTHTELGTASLVDLIEPEPAWQRSLNALANLADDGPKVAAPEETSLDNERLIWEINPKYGSVNLTPFLQKRSSSGWTAGRKVSLARLYEQFTSPEFAFLSEQDVALCRAIEVEVTRSYRYPETTYGFNDARAARALIGHPRVFRTGDRENPIEIVEQPPRLVVARQGSDIIRIKLDPAPSLATFGGPDPCRLIEEGPRRLAIVFFNEQHHKLQKIIGKMLDVPANAAQQVIDSLKSLSSLVAVHSEIGGDLPAAESVAGDPRPHVHLLPFQTGLRAEFFVRPFGDDGPFCRTGQDGANVFANLGGQSKSARRDLDQEQRRLNELLSACPALAQTEGYSASFPSPVEALDMLLQLEDYVAAGDSPRQAGMAPPVVLHWPQGQSLRLSGRAAASQLRLQIRKDRDWFAASGSLKVDRSLSIDMLKLIELVERARHGSSSWTTAAFSP